MGVLRAIATFAIFSFLLTAVPGPDTMIVLRSLVRSGRRASMWTAVGACMGTLFWGCAAALGVATLLLRSASAYEIVRLVGAVYLVLLGVASLRVRQATTHEIPRAAPAAEPGDNHPGWGESFRAGLLSDLLNPKVGLFFVAVIPQFLPASQSPTVAALLFALVDIMIALVWFALLIRAAHGVVHLLRRPRLQRGLQRLIGCVLITLGISVARTTLSP
jgi:threonine/homoserine/homoserine lactone efflux protein